MLGSAHNLKSLGEVNVAMELVRQLAIFVILIISVQAAKENLPLDDELPPKFHPPHTDTFMTRTIKAVTKGSPQCNSCNATAGASPVPFPQIHNVRESNVGTAKLVKFHCIKA